MLQDRLPPWWWSQGLGLGWNQRSKQTAFSREVVTITATVGSDRLVELYDSADCVEGGVEPDRLSLGGLHVGVVHGVFERRLAVGALMADVAIELDLGACPERNKERKKMISVSERRLCKIVESRPLKNIKHGVTDSLIKYVIRISCKQGDVALMFWAYTYTCVYRLNTND